MSRHACCRSIQSVPETAPKNQITPGRSPRPRHSIHGRTCDQRLKKTRSQPLSIKTSLATSAKWRSASNKRRGGSLDDARMQIRAQSTSRTTRTAATRRWRVEEFRRGAFEPLPLQYPNVLSRRALSLPNALASVPPRVAHSDHNTVAHSTDMVMRSLYRPDRDATGWNSAGDAGVSTCTTPRLAGPG